MGKLKVRSVKKRLIMGSDRDRELLANFRRKVGGSYVREREQMAKAIAQNSSPGQFSIPREKGFVVTPPGTWEQVEEMARIAREHVASVPAEELTGHKKSQLRTGFIKPDDLTLDSPQLQFALRTDILEAIVSYLGIVPVLWDVDVWYSHHQGGELSNSQLYHCDWDDTTQIKIFAYANEVRATEGPLVVLDAEKSQKLRDQKKYSFDFAKNRLSDEQAHQVVSPQDEVAIVGPPGTTAFVDTSRCFHYGSRSASPRILTYFQYLTPSAFKLPPDYREKLPYRHLADDARLTPLQRLVLGGAAGSTPGKS